MRTVTRGELTFDVVEHGPADGDPVLLLHGFPQRASSWAGVSSRLAGKGFRCVAPDQRGYSPGARPVGARAYAMDELVADALAVLDDVAGPDGRAHVVGHDWGAAVAWALGAWHRDRVRTLTAVSVPHPAAMAKAVTTSDQALRSYYMALFQLPVLPERVLLAGDAAVLRRFLRHDGLPAEFLDHYIERMREPGALSAALGWYRALPFGARDGVGRVRVPTLHVWGARDFALNRTGTEATAQFVDAPYRLEVMDDVTHWVPELVPDRLAELIATHVRTS